ncbi:MAG: hypothetical protein ACYTG0_19740 [Planctomycetota bacterium]|jgi:hypothetical protein
MFRSMFKSRSVMLQTEKRRRSSGRSAVGSRLTRPLAVEPLEERVMLHGLEITNPLEPVIVFSGGLLTMYKTATIPAEALGTEESRQSTHISGWDYAPGFLSGFVFADTLDALEIKSRPEDLLNSWYGQEFDVIASGAPFPSKSAQGQAPWKLELIPRCPSASQSWDDPVREFDGTPATPADISRFAWLAFAQLGTLNSAGFMTFHIMQPAPIIDITMLGADAFDGGVEFTYETTGNPGPFEVGLFRSADQDFDAGDIQLGSLQTIVPTGGQQTGTFNIASPLPSDPAKPFILVVADPNNLIGETDRANNVAFVGPLSDIAMQWAVVGYDVSYEYEVRGADIQQSFRIGFYRSEDEQLNENDVLIGSQSIIAPPDGTPTLDGLGDVATAQGFHWMLQWIEPVAADPARPFILVVLDDLENLCELDRSDNVFAIFAPTVEPDILATSLDWDTAAGGVEFEYSVQNADLPQTTTAALYWSQYASVHPSYSTLAYDTTVDTAQGDYGPYYVPNSVLGDPPSGTKYLVLFVDPDNLISESHESNNALAIPVLDILATSLDWNTAQARLDFSYQVKDADLPQTATGGLYWSADATFDAATDTLAIAQPFTINTQPNTYTDSIPVSDLTDPPLDTTHLLLVVDPPSAQNPNGLINESSESNNDFDLRVGWRTQLPRHYRQSQYPWGDDLLDGQQAETIASHGCALTSLSMALYKAGITRFGVNGQDVENNPGTLNQLLVEKKAGFSATGGLIFGDAASTAREAAKDVGINKAIQWYNAWPDTENKLGALIRDHDVPVIAKVESPKPGVNDHYVVVTGTILDRWFRIADPYWAYARLGSGWAGSPYNNYQSFKDLRGFVPDPVDLSELNVAVGALGAGVNLTVISSQDEATGIDPLTGETREEIPNSAHYIDGIGNAITGDPPTGFTQQVFVARPDVGSYQIEVFSDEAKPYTLHVATYARDGTSQGRLAIPGYVEPNGVSTFEISFDSSADHQVQLTQVVTLDIKPGSDSNPINLKSRGKIPVAVLTTPDFDATTVDTSDLSQIQFGDPELTGRVSPLRARLEDVDDDGDTDLILHFSVREINAERALNADSVIAELTATSLIDSTPLAIRGADSVRIVPPSMSDLLLFFAVSEKGDRDDTEAIDAAFAEFNEILLLSMM